MSSSYTYCSSTYYNSINIAVIIVPIVLGSICIIVIGVIVAIRNKRRLSKAKKVGVDNKGIVGKFVEIF